MCDGLKFFYEKEHKCYSFRELKVMSSENDIWELPKWGKFIEKSTGWKLLDERNPSSFNLTFLKKIDDKNIYTVTKIISNKPKESILEYDKLCQETDLFGNPFSDYKKEEIVVIFDEKGTASVCYTKEELLKTFWNQEKITVWIPDEDDELQPTEFLLYKLPYQGIWINQKAAEKLVNSTHSFFSTQFIFEKPIGNIEGIAGVSRLHGALEKIYTIIPIEEKVFLESGKIKEYDNYLNSSGDISYKTRNINSLIRKMFWYGDTIICDSFPVSLWKVNEHYIAKYLHVIGAENYDYNKIIRDVAYSTLGYVAIGYNDDIISIYSLENRIKNSIYTKNKSLLYSPNGKYLMVTTGKSLLIYENYKIIKEININLYHVTFSNDNKTFAIIHYLNDDESIISIFNIENDNRIDLENKNYISDLCFSPDGKYIASCGINIDIWDIETRKIISSFKSVEKVKTNIKYFPNGTHVIFGIKYNGGFYIWRIGTDKYKKYDIEKLTSFTISEDGKTIAYSTHNPTLIKFIFPNFDEI